jgi:hypothetical protein
MSYTTSIHFARQHLKVTRDKMKAHCDRLANSAAFLEE